MVNVPAKDAAEAPSPPSVVTGASFDLVVGSERGLEAWNREGLRVRVISAAPAEHPRWLDAETLVVLAAEPGRDLTAGFRLEAVNVATGRRSVAARVPAFTCPGKLEHEPLGVHATTDFLVDRERQLVCVRLYEGVPFLATFGLQLSIDLAQGNVSRSVFGQPRGCALTSGSTASRAEFCSTPALATPSPDTSRFQLSEDDDGVVVAGSVPPLAIPGYASEAVSPSGRWVLLSGDFADGDYVHRRLLLLDMRTGELFAVPAEATAWPAPLALLGVDTAVHTPVEGARDVVGESDVRWLGTDEASELLVIDGDVARPGRSVFRVDGHVAR